MHLITIRKAALLGLASLAVQQPEPATGQGPASTPASLPGNTVDQLKGLGAASREAMWYAPTEEDWKKPVLIPFQRTFDDAIEVSKETGKPILICVNMDGEIASEHYAGIRYRQPEIAQVYSKYVAVIASVYRHNARDYDDQGKRILCPRFGSVTCGEHIAIEPVLYEKYFEGQRVAPRHIGVDLQRKENFDVYYAWDTQSVFKSVYEGAKNFPDTGLTGVHGDQPLPDRVASSHNEDRSAVENAYMAADQSTRRAILQKVIAKGADHSPDVLRLSLYDLDVELNRLARQALAKSNSPAAIDLIAQALRVPMDNSERDALVAALERIGKTNPRAATLAKVFRGLSNSSSAVDVDGWTRAMESGKASNSKPAQDSYEAEARLAGVTRAAMNNPENPDAKLDFAENSLNYAYSVRGSRKSAKLFFQDAYLAAQQAEKLGAKGWRVNSTLALSAFHLGQVEEAYTRAESAVQSMPGDAMDWNAMSVLAIFAESRQKAIAKATREHKEWPPQWLTDVHSAYSVLEKHPFSNDSQAVSHYDFLRQLGAAEPAARALKKGLERFPDSALIHDRMRQRLLEDKGAAGIEAAYEAMLRENPTQKDLEWFAGYASLVAAEFHRRDRKPDAALAAYQRGIEHYEKNILLTPENRDSADHFIALALAGRARVHFEAKDYETAVTELLNCFQRRPDSAASLDGLNISPVDTAKMARARFEQLKMDGLAEKLQKALAALDPEMLELPAYERAVQNEGPPASRPNRRRQR